MSDFAGQSVFITGATGFIGSHLARRLVSQGARVSALMRPGSSTRRVTDILDRMQVFEGDLSDLGALQRMLATAKPRYLFHLAAYTLVDRDWAHAEIAMRVNLEGTMHLTHALSGMELTCMVNSGTCEEYGDAPPPIDEEQPAQPVSPYSVSKAAATLWCQMLHRTAQMPIVTVRPFLSYGPWQEPVRLIPQAILAAIDGKNLPMTNGEQTREFTHVDDIVDGYLRAAATPEAAGQVINLGSGMEHQVRDVVRTIFVLAQARGQPLLGAVPYRAAEIWRCVSSNAKARRILGWQPRISLEQGLRDTIAWYRNHRAAAGGA